MGTNASLLHVRLAKGIGLDDVEDAIVASYVARGARLGGRRFAPKLERRAEPPRSAKLGVAVGPPEDGWVPVLDSFGYTSDARLAGDIAERLGTTVFRATVADAAGYTSLERFGKVRPAREAPADMPEYRELDGSETEVRFLFFEAVTARAYASGPAVVVEVRCASCGYDAGWSPGLDVPSAPRPDQLIPLDDAGDGAAKRASLLVELRCPNCRGEIGWARATLEAGLITALRRLEEEPARARPRFQFALRSQKAALERAFPERRRAEEAATEALTGAFAASPRPALEAALARVLPTIRRTRPPLLSWVFAANATDLVAAAEARFREFAWKPNNLPGDVALQIRAWLGPDPGAPALEQLLGFVRGRLTRAAFARQARHPKTMAWVVIVCFPLPDETWAALALVDSYRP
jgi:hypothetical protein